MTGTIFLHSEAWTYSLPTSSGFRHYPLGRLTGIHTKADAEARAVELIAAGEIPA